MWSSSRLVWWRWKRITYFHCNNLHTNLAFVGHSYFITRRRTHNWRRNDASVIKIVIHWTAYWQIFSEIHNETNVSHSFIIFLNLHCETATAVVFLSRRTHFGVAAILLFYWICTENLVNARISLLLKTKKKIKERKISKRLSTSSIRNNGRTEANRLHGILNLLHSTRSELRMKKIKEKETDRSLTHNGTQFPM